VALVVDPAQFIAATATDPANNTSAFSLCVEVVGPSAFGVPAAEPLAPSNESGAFLNPTDVNYHQDPGFRVLTWPPMATESNATSTEPVAWGWVLPPPEGDRFFSDFLAETDHPDLSIAPDK
jgi:hypothetical protein